MKKIIVVILIVFVFGCTGHLSSKSPEELAATPVAQLCESYFIVTGNANAATMEIGKEELRTVLAEFSNRGVPPEKIVSHCSQ